jgi:hypothetical protein
MTRSHWPMSCWANAIEDGWEDTRRVRESRGHVALGVGPMALEAQAVYLQTLRYQNLVHCFFRWNGYGAFLLGIRRQRVPRLWPFARFPRLGDPSDTSSAP